MFSTKSLPEVWHSLQMFYHSRVTPASSSVGLQQNYLPNAEYGAGLAANFEEMDGLVDRKCIPHSRCVVGDLLSPEGALTIQVKIDFMGQNCPSGIQDKTKLDKLDNKVDKLDTKLVKLDTKMDKHNSKLALRKLEENQGSEKCPMYSRVVKKPMRLG